MARPMTKEEYTAFLGEGTRTGKLATVGKDGRPHVVPIWFVVDGDDLVFMTGEATVKGKHMARDPRVALSVDHQEPPFSFVTVEGTVTLEPYSPAMLAWSIRIAERYVGKEMAEAFGKRNAVPGELLVRVTPTKVLAMMDMVA